MPYTHTVCRIMMQGFSCIGSLLQIICQQGLNVSDLDFVLCIAFLCATFLSEKLTKNLGASQVELKTMQGACIIIILL